MHEKIPIKTDSFLTNFIIPNLFPNMFKAFAEGKSRGGHSHKLGHAYARTARVWFLQISVLERVAF